MPQGSALFIGISGTILALDRVSGQEIWRSSLKGSDFVNVVLDDGMLYATTKGEIFCLDPSTGNIRWNNRLKGLGTGLVTIASRDGQQVVPGQEKRRRDAEAAAGAAAAAG